MSSERDPAVEAQGSPRCFPHAREAFLWACWSDVAVRKPGNVSLDSPGHAMEAGQFLASAQVSADALLQPGQGVGARVHAAACATRSAVACNTNLGILLLCAPLACAAERASASSPAALAESTEAVLGGLDPDDAEHCYAAIRVANPGGLGKAEQQDVHGPVTLGLREAMRLAAQRDEIARHYAEGYGVLFDEALPGLLDGARQPGARHDFCVLRLYLHWLAECVDSHIARKFDVATARAVRDEARAWRARLDALTDPDPTPLLAGLAAWDASLKARGINPGTSADLTVATLFAAALLRPELLAFGHAGQGVAQDR